MANMARELPTTAPPVPVKAHDQMLKATGQIKYEFDTADEYQRALTTLQQYSQFEIKKLFPVAKVIIVDYDCTEGF